MAKKQLSSLEKLEVLEHLWTQVGAKLKDSIKTGDEPIADLVSAYAQFVELTDTLSTVREGLLNPLEAELDGSR